MGSRMLGEVAGMIWNQTFNVLNTANETTPMATSNAATYDMTAKFNPSMAIIIIVLISAFLFMGFFSIYVRRCTSSGVDNATQLQPNSRPANNENRPGQGLDRAVVETLPLVGYSLVKGLKGGKDLSECAVCLSEFEDDETLRLLPKCGHLFHPECIDMWFFSHSTCPLCRSSLVPAAEGKGASTPQEGSRGNVSSDGGDVAITIHDGPPVPPNGSILELLSRENADRLLTESLRRDAVLERMDLGLASREENVGDERAVELRALNRALSRNSTSFRKAAREITVTERIGAASESARFPASTLSAAALNGTGMMGPAYMDKRSHDRSVGSSQSFNLMVLRRSSSMGSSGRYIRQLFGNNYVDYFSPETAGDGLRVDRARLLGEHRMPAKGSSKAKRDKNEDELHNLFFNELQNMTYTEDNRHGTSVQRNGELWDSIDLQQNDNGSRAQPPAAAAAQEQTAAGSYQNNNNNNNNDNNALGGELPIWQRNLDVPSNGKSGELPPVGSRIAERRIRLQEVSGPLYVRRKSGSINRSGAVAGDGGTRSDRWNFSIRRTFSLRRTFSDSREQLESAASSQNESSSTRWWQLGAGSSSSRPKKYSPWAGAMKDRRSRRSADYSASTPATPLAYPSPSSVFSPYALSLPSPPVLNQSSSGLPNSPTSTASNLPFPSATQSESSPDQSRHQQQQQTAPESQIQIITQ